MSSASQLDADVLIVGAGPVGLSMALELGLRGRRVVLIERDPSRGPQPRAKTLNMRSLGHMRRWGVADAVRAASPNPPDLPTDIVFQTRLFGHHLATLPNIYFRGNERQHDERFPEPSEWIPQYLVEQALKAKLETLDNVSIRYGVELLNFEQTPGEVLATLNAKGEDIALRSRFIVGADGARSRVRALIGAEMVGRHAMASHFNVVMRIPELDTLQPPVRGIMHWIINGDTPCVMGPMGPHWHIGKTLAEGEADLTRDQVADFLKSATGRDLDFEIVSTDRWYAHELVADRYRDRNAFLVGDACHLHPPFGGYGMNMGIADAVDLGWKLDAVLGGWGGERLLESYEWERKRVHRWTIDESLENYKTLARDLDIPGLEDDTEMGAQIRQGLGQAVIAVKRREFHTIGIVLGYHYGGSPVVVGGEDLPGPVAEEYHPVAEPGAMAPHFWLEPGVSVYDRFGRGLTLIDTVGDLEGRGLFHQAAQAAGVPLKELVLTGERAKALYGEDLFLVRPDEHVAWRGRIGSVAEADALLKTVTGA